MASNNHSRTPRSIEAQNRGPRFESSIIEAFLYSTKFEMMKKSCPSVQDSNSKLFTFQTTQPDAWQWITLQKYGRFTNHTLAMPTAQVYRRNWRAGWCGMNHVYIQLLERYRLAYVVKRCVMHDQDSSAKGVNQSPHDVDAAVTANFRW